jgi:hypothetical protein
MRLRNREVRCRSDTDSASPVTFEDVSQEDETGDHASNRDADENERPQHGDEHEGHSGPTEEVSNWQDWSDRPTSNSASQQVWNPDDSGGSRPVFLGPPRTDYYPKSEVKYTDKGWSYEIETYNELYRISTIPSDFFGNVRK